MKQRRRIYYSESQKALMWERCTCTSTGISVRASLRADISFACSTNVTRSPTVQNQSKWQKHLVIAQVLVFADICAMSLLC